VNSIPSTSASAPAPTAPAQSVADREVRLTTWLLAAALLVGLVLQVWLPPGGVTLVGGAALAGVLVFALSYVVPGRLRETIAGFRFVSSLLFVLAILAVLGTLVLQGKPPEFYFARYGGVGKFIVALRFDDIFHGLPFSLLMALFGAAVTSSATLRWPIKARNSGFFICHVGLMTSLLGAAASTTLSIRGRIDLHSGGEIARQVRVTKLGQGPTGELAQLGFALKLDRFELVNYEPEFRIGYYEQVTAMDEDGVLRDQWRLKASFDPDLEKHRLPSGDSFRLKGVYPDFAPRPSQSKPGLFDYASASSEWKNPAVLMEIQQTGLPRDELMIAARPQAVMLSPTRALIFERRDKEVKAFISHVSASQGAKREQGVVSVNDPFSFAGWTLYQVNYNPNDPTYSGLDAVYDPGVTWVFTGFGLISLGVFFMFYVEPRFKAARKTNEKAATAAAA
jgi:hypothetical protein